MKKTLYLLLAVQLIGATLGGFVAIYYGDFMAAFVPFDMERMLSCVAY